VPQQHPALKHAAEGEQVGVRELHTDRVRP
jgi:hypothetical protein